MEHAQPLPAAFPWRAAAVLATGIALLELVALIAIGLVHLGPHGGVAATRTHPSLVTNRHKAELSVPVTPSVPLRPRGRVRVLVLNGNGVGGAAAAEASQLRSRGYRIGGATNAARHDYAQSMVMFVPGWSKEARRLAHDAGVSTIAPVDGITHAQLQRSQVILLLGR